MSVVALGTFDGVHLGHQRIVKDAVSYARRKNLFCIATTFDPHPQQVVIPGRGLKLLTTLPERKKLLRSLGVDKVKVLKFNKRLRRMNYEEFIEKYLVGKLKAFAVFIGYDYAFGYERYGGVKEIKKLGKKYGFKVKVIKPFKHKGRLVKSSVIRNLISNGELKKAAHLLGHFYMLSGKVIYGAGRGKTLGFPTANLSIDPLKLLPHHGVYAARINSKKCLVNIGSRPTFGIQDTAVEVYMPGFTGNLYGKTLNVELLYRIRDEMQFADIEKLKEQIRRDVAKRLESVL